MSTTLKRLELNGFKSFARKGIFEFKTPITTIVGPNGAGKSNVVEAIRFVLGEQSMKSLRSKRGEDLIFNGSRSVPRQALASVVIVFDNTGRTFDIDYDEVEIKRIVYRDSTSQYLINGSPVRLKDIIELLASVHIGTSGHHIVSQGGADRILNASIEERRAMIEDALGLKVYQYKKEESERKLQKTRENLKHVEALRHEVAPHLKFLEKQVEKIRKAEGLRCKLRELCTEYFSREVLYWEEHSRSLEREREAPQKELALMEKKIEEAEHTLEEVEERKKRSAPVLPIERALENLRLKKDSLQRGLGRLEGIIEYGEGRIKKQSRGVSEKDMALVPLDSINAFKKEIELYISRAEKENSISLLQSIIEDIGRATATFLSLCGISKESHGLPPACAMPAHAGGMAHAGELVQRKKEKEVLEGKLAKLQEEEGNLTISTALARQDIEKEKDTLREAERTLFIMRNRRSELFSRLELLKVRDEKIREERINLKTELEEARETLGRDLFLDSARQISRYKESMQEPRSEQESRRRKIERMKIKIEDIGGGGGEIMKEYEEAMERDRFLQREIEDLEKSASSLQSLIKDLGEKINLEFKEGVAKINKAFQEFFSLMFDGGRASIKVVSAPPRREKNVDLVPSSLDNFEEIGTLTGRVEGKEEEGIDVIVNFPYKRIKGLHVLSGGERALASIALIFAITQVNPPPFLVLDETDAALDEANSRKYSRLLEKLSRNTEFIIVTHNRETMAKAGVLYGVTMDSQGMSRLLSVKLDEAVEISE